MQSNIGKLVGCGDAHTPHDALGESKEAAAPGLDEPLSKWGHHGGAVEPVECNAPFMTR